MITIKLLDSINKIEQNINKASAEVINDKLFKNQSSILNKSKSLAVSWLMIQPEIISLLSSSKDSLAGQFGIPVGLVSNVISSIKISFENSINIKFVKYNDKLRGGLEINFQPNDFINLLSLPQGHTIYSGGDLHWLDWLLKRGNNIIVINYQYNPLTGFGRSGLGIMVPGGSFRVPPQFSGTDKDNFITRALIGTNQEQQISKIIQDALK